MKILKNVIQLALENFIIIQITKNVFHIVLLELILKNIINIIILYVMIHVMKFLEVIIISQKKIMMFLNVM